MITLRGRVLGNYNKGEGLITATVLDKFCLHVISKTEKLKKEPQVCTSPSHL